MAQKAATTDIRRRVGRAVAGCAALAALLPCLAQAPADGAASLPEPTPTATSEPLRVTPSDLAALPTGTPLLRSGFGSLTAPSPAFASLDNTPRLQSFESFRTAPVGGSRRFIDQELLPTVDRYLHHAAAVDLGAPTTASLFDHVYYEELHRQSQRGLQRGCEKALQEMLIREATLDRVVTRVEDRMAKNQAGKNPGRTRFRVEVGSLRPELGIKQRLPSGNLRVRVTLDGDVRLDFADTRIGRNFRIGCRLEPGNDRYTFGGHFGF